MTASEYVVMKQEQKTTMCAAILYPDGNVEECIKSHLETMIDSLGSHIWEQIPAEESPLFWLTAHMGVVLIDYENQLYSEQLTKEQQKAMKEMYEGGILLEHLKDIHNGNHYLGVEYKKSV